MKNIKNFNLIALRQLQSQVLSYKIKNEFDNEFLIWDNNFQTDHVREGCCENDIDVLGRLGVDGGGDDGPHQGRLHSIVHSNFFF